MQGDFTCDETKTYCECPHALEFPYDKRQWAEIILISDRRNISHPIHQHGGWYWVVGGDVFDHPINRTFIMDLHAKGELTYTNSVRSLPKDVIQVPRNGYVIIRTKLDNPGAWIFHCHIDFHLRKDSKVLLFMLMLIRISL